VQVDTKEIRIRRGVILKALQRARCGLALGCAGAGSRRDFAGRGTFSRYVSGPPALCGTNAQGNAIFMGPFAGGSLAGQAFFLLHELAQTLLAMPGDAGNRAQSHQNDLTINR
jgi:hypothetical protein